MKTKLFALMLIMLPVFMVSCKKDNPGGMNTGQMYVRMMDAPSPYNFDRVNVDVLSVEVSMAGTSSWITLQTNAGVYNLLDLVNGVDTLVAGGQIVAGQVEQMRFLLGTNNSVVVSGITYPMDVPSGSTSGLKLNIHQNVTPSQPLTVFVDFDAAHSIVLNGNGSYSLKPVLNAFVASETGFVFGRITPATSGIAISIGELKPTETTYANPITGEFMLRGIKSGSYTVRVYPANSDIPIVISNVVVTAGAGTDIGLIQLPL